MLQMVFYVTSAMTFKIKISLVIVDHISSQNKSFLFFFHFSFIIHMCIQGLVHFSALPPPPPLPPTPPPPAPHLNTQQKLFCPYL
jgi:hypothetical protein